MLRVSYSLTLSTIAGIKEIILCKQNRKDIQEIEQRYINDLTIHYVDKVEDVLSIALLSEKVKKAMIVKIDNNDKVN